jgi:hypothetical protein
MSCKHGKDICEECGPVDPDLPPGFGEDIPTSDVVETWGRQFEAMAARRAPVGIRVWAIEYEQAGRVWQTTAEAYSRDEAIAAFTVDNPKANFRACWEKEE